MEKINHKRVGYSAKHKGMGVGETSFEITFFYLFSILYFLFTFFHINIVLYIVEIS